MVGQINSMNAWINVLMLADNSFYNLLGENKME